MGQNTVTPYAFYHLNKHMENQQVVKNTLMDLNHDLNPFPSKRGSICKCLGWKFAFGLYAHKVLFLARSRAVL